MRVAPAVADELADVGRQLAHARDEVDRMTAIAKATALRLLDAGQISETQCALRLGVNRATVRDWRQKR